MTDYTWTSGKFVSVFVAIGNRCVQILHCTIYNASDVISSRKFNVDMKKNYR